MQNIKSVEDNPQESLVNRYTFAEELFNSISHGIGAVLSIAALVILVSFASIKGDIWRIVSFSIYGATLIFLYTSSTLYHSIFHEKAKRVFRVFDHVAIFIFIAGCYTPITLVAMRDKWGWALFGVVWGIAIIGTILKIFALNKLKKFSVFLYVLMGWLVIVAIKPMLEILPQGLFPWLLAGGLLYTVGVVFYVWKRLPFNHGVWHLFVLAGSSVHFLGILFYLA